MTKQEPTIQELQEQLAAREQQMFDLVDRRIAERFAAGGQSREGEIEALKRDLAARDAQIARQIADWTVDATELESENAELQVGLATAELANEKMKQRIAELERQLALQAKLHGLEVETLNAKLDDVLLKDRGKTTEINLLVAENRTLASALKERGVDVGELMPRSFKGTADRIAAIVDAASVYVGHRVSAGGIDDWLKELGADELYDAVRVQEAIERGGEK